MNPNLHGREEEGGRADHQQHTRVSVPRLLLEKVALDAPVKRSNTAWHDPKFSA